MRRFLLVLATVATGVLLAAYLTVPRLRVDDPLLHRLVLSVFVLAIALVFRAYLDTLMVWRVRGAHGRYLVHKAIGALTVAGSLLALVTIWIEDVRAIGVTLGLVGAGVAVALQKPITSVFGLLVILTNRLFQVGDRIQIGETKGDVVDVRAFYVTLMEVEEWMDGETWTGRLVTIPNYVFLEQELANYTKDFHYLWDVVMVPVTLRSDWRKAERLLRDAAEEHTSHLREGATEDLSRMTGHYMVGTYNVEPRTFVKPTDDWIEVSVRFVTTPRGRKAMKSRILRTVLDRLERETDVEIASERLLLHDRDARPRGRGRGGAAAP